jgi:flagellin
MSLVVNTNVSSLTAQRALAYADSLQGEAMTRLSTGSKLNSASDDAAGLAIASRMTAQVNGLNMAVKNANDGIALTQSIEGALVEVSDMVQRIRELSVQASNDTNTDSDRAFIQEEVNLLIAEITRISSNTRYNGQLVLDGSFTNRQMQVGTEGGETITVNVDSVASDMLGAYEITGDRIEAFNGNGAGSYGNITDAADDIIINGNSLSKTIDVAAGDSARAVAAKINNVSGETGVTAEAKTYALLSSEYATDETYSVLINNKTTGSFVLSNSNVLDAVDKINAISGSTGVTATATTDNKVRLYASDGADILIESQSTGTALKVQSMSHDGESVQPAK